MSLWIRTFLAAFIIIGFGGQVESAPDWVGDLTERINHMNLQLHNNIAYMNEHIQRSIKNELAASQQQVEDSLKNAREGGNLNTFNSNSVFSMSSNTNGKQESISRSIQSGVDADGHPYHVETDVNGNNVLRKITSYDPKTGKNEVKQYTFDITDPDHVKPVH